MFFFKRIYIVFIFNFLIPVFFRHPFIKFDIYYISPPTKYGKGLHFMIAGDTDDLKLDNILNLSANMQQHVLDPPAMLDPIMSTLGCYYQQPVCLPPLDADPDSNGSPSDHLIVVMRPVDSVNNKPGRIIREVKVRPLTDSGLKNSGL